MLLRYDENPHAIEVPYNGKLVALIRFARSEPVCVEAVEAAGDTIRVESRSLQQRDPIRALLPQIHLGMARRPNTLYCDSSRLEPHVIMYVSIPKKLAGGRVLLHESPGSLWMDTDAMMEGLIADLLQITVFLPRDALIKVPDERP